MALEEQEIRDVLGVELPSPLEKIDLEPFVGFSFPLWIKRDDKIHRIISGNKYRKLQGNLTHYFSSDYGGIISFGGAYSNHLHALAYACHKLDIPLCAIIRGEEPPTYSQTLQDIKGWGARLNFISREEYRRRDNPEYLSTLQIHHPDYFIIPEGGSNTYARIGLDALYKEIKEELSDPLEIILPVGSGGTILGLYESMRSTDNLTGVSALRGVDFYPLFTGDSDKKVEVWEDYHFGGFGRVKPELTEFIRKFESEYSILLDPVYTGKMFYAIIDQVKSGNLSTKKSAVAVHTGGIQGKRNL